MMLANKTERSKQTDATDITDIIERDLFEICSKPDEKWRSIFAISGPATTRKILRSELTWGEKHGTVELIDFTSREPSATATGCHCEVTEITAAEPKSNQ